MSPNDADYYRIASEYERVSDELDKLKREWIDPQRIVELARNYTDQDKAGWVQVYFEDHDPMFGPQWIVDTPHRNSQHHGRTLDEALKEAES